jgi:hypothetical protein
MIHVTLRDTTTGEVRVWTSDIEWGDVEHPAFIWEEGNFACDCNRAQFFARAIGAPEPTCPPCGDWRYVIDQITDANGVVVYTEP